MSNSFCFEGTYVSIMSPDCSETLYAALIPSNCTSFAGGNNIFEYGVCSESTYALNITTCFDGTCDINNCQQSTYNTSLCQSNDICQSSANETTLRELSLSGSTVVLEKYQSVNDFCNDSSELIAIYYFYEQCVNDSTANGGSYIYSCIFGFGPVYFSYNDTLCQQQQGFSFVSGCKNGVNVACSGASATYRNLCFWHFFVLLMLFGFITNYDLLI